MCLFLLCTGFTSGVTSRILYIRLYGNSPESVFVMSVFCCCFCRFSKQLGLKLSFFSLPVETEIRDYLGANSPEALVFAFLDLKQLCHRVVVGI